MWMCFFAINQKNNRTFAPPYFQILLKRLAGSGGMAKEAHSSGSVKDIRYAGQYGKDYSHYRPWKREDTDTGIFVVGWHLCLSAYRRWADQRDKTNGINQITFFNYEKDDSIHIDNQHVGCFLRLR